MLEQTIAVRWVLLIAVLVGSPPAARAQQGRTETYEAEELYRHFQNQAESYSIRSGSDRLILRRQPLMHWGNPIRSQEQGALYVWTKDDLPHALASIFTYQYNEQVFCRHEWLSLSDGPLIARLGGKAVWTPNRPGVRWTEITDVAPPSNSSARRLTQMRGIARQFTGSLLIPDQQPTRLVLKPQPAMRYTSQTEGVIDGAIFSLAVATDPEIWLRIEAKAKTGGSTGWFYAAARSHYHALELRHNDKLVWSQPMVLDLENARQAQQPYASDPYFIFHAADPLPDPEELR